MTTPLRVAVDLTVVSDGDRGGVARFALGMTEALAEREHVTVLPLAPTAIPDLALPVHRITGRGQVARTQVGIPSLLRSLDADVLLSPANRGLPVVSPCPMVLVLHDVFDWEPTLSHSRDQRDPVKFAAASTVAFSRASLIVTMSDFVAGMVRRRLGIDEERIRVAPGGVDARFFDDPGGEAIGHVRTAYGVIPGSVLHVGSLRARRDLPTLVRAVASLPAEVVPRLVLAGAGPEEESLRSMARMIGVSDRLHLTGFVDEADLPAVYRASSCVVLAGSGEGFGLPVLEAMAGRVPVIAARAGALPEAVGRGGLLFPAGDHPALARHLRELLTSPREAERLRVAGLDQARRFTWAKAARKMDDVLREALQPSFGARVKSQLGALRSLRRWLS